MLWAFKQVYPDIQAIPVFDSYYVKSLGVFDVYSINALLSPLSLNVIPSSPQHGGQWNFISTLYYNALINGFIGDNYTVGAEGLIPIDALPFYNQQPPIPYLLQSSYSVLPKESTLPLKSGYQGDLPLNASIYFGDGPSATFDPSVFLTPEPISLGQAGVIHGSQAPDKLIGTPTAELLIAHASDDIVHARAGNDPIFGKGGRDRLFGQDGDDVIDGGRGRNKAWGGAGQDTFVLSRKGITKILDFDSEFDSIQILDVPGYSIRSRRGSTFVLDADKNLIGLISGFEQGLTILPSPVLSESTQSLRLDILSPCFVLPIIDINRTLVKLWGIRVDHRFSLTLSLLSGWSSLPLATLPPAHPNKVQPKLLRVLP